MDGPFAIKQSLYRDQDSKYMKALRLEDEHEFLVAALKLIEDQSVPKYGGDRGEVFWKINRKGQSKKTSVFLSHAHDWICWFQTGFLGSVKKQTRHVEISHIVRVDEGQSSSNFTKASQFIVIPEEIKDKSFSLIAHDRTISLVARSAAVCRVWTRALSILLEISRSVGVDYYMGKNAFSMYLQEQWNRADTDRSGIIDSNELFEVTQKMNINTTKQQMKKRMRAHKLDKIKPGLNLEEFTNFFRELFSDRPEIVELVNLLHTLQQSTGVQGKRSKHSAESNELRISASDFRLFYNTYQLREDEPEMTMEEAIDEILEYAEEDDMGLIEFAQYLDDDKNSIFDPQRRAAGAGSDLDKYMSFPLNHYWINSSHNTYLTGDQLHGISSSDQYTYVLQNGCRCVELDCWDGEKVASPGTAAFEPIITHGHTMCTKIFFRDVIKTLKTRAFGPPANNPYPVILSIEMHCSVPFQEKMYEICQTELGDMLYLLPPDCSTMDRLPSPRELMGKILIKGKRSMIEGDFSEDSQDDAAVDDDWEDEFGGGLSPSAAPSADSPVASQSPLARSATARAAGTSRFLSRIGIRSECTDTYSLQVAAELELPSVSSLPRNQAASLNRVKTKSSFLSGTTPFESLISIVGVKHKGFSTVGQVYEISSYSETKATKLCANSREQWMKHNLRQFSRVYPKGTRVDSSNLDPVRPWGAGVQLVALNFQTGDEPIQLNFGRFMENKGFGYVLRPAFMRETGDLDTLIFSCSMPLSKNILVQVLSCQRLPNNKGSKDIADVFCKVAVHGSNAEYKEYCTEVVNNNGFNPCFVMDPNSFDFEVTDRDCAMLRFSVWDQDATGNEFIGQMAMPVSCIRQGYRHVPLFDAHNSRLGITTGLLCRVSIEPM